MDQKQINKLAKKIWDYHLMHQKLEKADCILALGSNDLRVAEKAAELFLEGWAPILVFSGGKGSLTPAHWKSTEAHTFAERAIEMGVPKEKILIEDQSTNTSENIRLTKSFFANNNLNPNKIILVQKPHMERRAYATFKKVCPEKEVIVTSPQIPFEKYAKAELRNPIDMVVGDLQRIKIYGERGFLIPQDIPDDIWDAYKKLVVAGYTSYLVKENQ